MLVILWTDSWTRAWACSCSMNWESSCWGDVSGRGGDEGATDLCRVVELVHGTLACEAGCVVDDETGGEKSLRQNLVHRAHHFRLMDTVRASLVFLISLPSFSGPPPSPSPHGLLLHPLPRPVPVFRIHQRLAAKPAHPVRPLLPQPIHHPLLIEFSRFTFQYYSVCRQEGSAHKACRFRASLAKGHPI